MATGPGFRVHSYQRDRVPFSDHLRQRDHTFFVAKWFARQEQKPGLLLDLPTGNTRDTRELIRMGYGVISSDLFPSKKRGEPDGLCWLQADMWAPIPLKDASLDYILNSEGIEHISDQFAFLKECARVLKRRGILAITTPNLLSLRARVAFMLAGNRAFKSFVDEETSVWYSEGNKIYHGHAFLINYFQLRYILHHSGFRIREVVGTHYGTSSTLLLPFLAPFVWLFTRLAMGKAQRKNPGSPIYREIRRDVFSLPMLLSKNLFVIAERRDETVLSPLPADGSEKSSELHMEARA